MDGAKRVWLNSAAARAWTVVAVALAAAVWHGWAITVTPERPTFWVLVFLDLLVAGLAGWLATWWPRNAGFEPEELVLGRTRIRYDSIVAARFGHVSAKPFWLAFWLPQSPVVGLVLAVRRPEAFDRKVIELDTPTERHRLRWRYDHPYEQFTDALRSAWPEYEPEYGLDGRNDALDHTPKMSTAGGFLAVGLSVWTLCTVLFGIELLDRSTVHQPNSAQDISSSIRALTAKLKDYPRVDGVAVYLTSERCQRDNNLFLGPSPEYVELALEINGAKTPSLVADDIEARLRADVGMEPRFYSQWLNGYGTVMVDIPEVGGLDIRVETHCVEASGEATVREDLRQLVTALGISQ